jgi:DNA-binding response OmpR family regulator
LVEMSDALEKRRRPDRRRFARGGRRETDVAGFTPLVFVVDARPSGREACEAILAKLRFAVAPFDSLDKAKRAMEGLKPDLVLVARDLVDELRRSVPAGRNEMPLPILTLPDGEPSMETLIEEVRRALRAGMSAPSNA